MEESKKRVRRSVEERAAELDKKILAHREAIKALEEKKADLFRPKKRRRTEAEISKELISKAKKAGMSSKEIAEKLGLSID
ncbi:MAG: hypothetical protein HFF16_02815 [Angelakisella sp.]|jgi:hypothetical protein|nr:hypothetical protein [Angelakisella sp.]MCI9528611.1 hypothetical protein [Angelakisella sp.]